MKTLSLSAMVLTIGLASYCSATMASEIHLIVKNDFHDGRTTLSVNKLSDLTYARVRKDSLTDSILNLNTRGKSAGELTLSSYHRGDFTKAITINTSHHGSCTVDFTYHARQFLYSRETGKACKYAATVLKQKGSSYFIMLDFTNAHA